METTLSSRIKQAWNAFLNRDPTSNYRYDSNGSYYRPDRIRLSRGNERSIVTSVFNRIALDVASVSIRHCRLDDDGRYQETIDSNLNNCLTLEANLDQTSRAFFQDIVMSMFGEGCVALIPVDTTMNPNQTGSYDILTLRTAKIVEWYPEKIKVNLYNEKTGKKEDIIINKNIAAIIENPLFAVMNEPNSTLQRLMRKLVLLDTVDEQTSSGKLDLIIQLPYSIKTEARREQADQRKQDIERQLTGSRYGIAYVDSTEKVTQLNRPIESNLMKQIEYLTNLLYSQLGITQTILDGTADAKTMNNYNTRVIEPIVAAITEEMRRKFLTKTARSQKQTILYFIDPFKLVPVNDLAELADKFTRNEILSSNEFRQIIGRKPSNDPKADQLVNSNISQPTNMMSGGPYPEEGYEDEPVDGTDVESGGEESPKDILYQVIDTMSDEEIMPILDMLLEEDSE